MFTGPLILAWLNTFMLTIVLYLKFMPSEIFQFNSKTRSSRWIQSSNCYSHAEVSLRRAKLWLSFHHGARCELSLRCVSHTHKSIYPSFPYNLLTCILARVRCRFDELIPFLVFKSSLKLGTRRWNLTDALPNAHQNLILPSPVIHPSSRPFRLGASRTFKGLIFILSPSQSQHLRLCSSSSWNVQAVSVQYLWKQPREKKSPTMYAINTSPLKPDNLGAFRTFRILTRDRTRLVS